MPSSPPPKAILFDIGGVCVLSPFQAILDYEIDNNIPPGYINFAIQKGPSATGAWQRLERGACELNDAWFHDFRAQLENRSHWEEFWHRSLQSASGRENESAGRAPPPAPAIDAKTLFWRMMKIARTPDPWIYPALLRLRQSGRFVLGALSNTVVFPPGIVDEQGVLFDKLLVHAPDSPHAAESRDITTCFDVFVSSAHAGVRKPDARAYEMAVEELDRVSRRKGRGGLVAADVLFLDDIGGNLKAGRACGLKTLKVGLGRTREAIVELERATGVDLLVGGTDKARL